MIRPSVDEVLMAIAEMWSQRGTCARLQVGAVIARDGRTLSSGYNGAPQGLPHCKCGTGEVDPSNPCTTAVHAEANAIAFAACYGIQLLGASLYTTDSPCFACAQLIVSAGIHEVIYEREFADMRGSGMLRQAGIEMYQFPRDIELYPHRR